MNKTKYSDRIEQLKDAIDQLGQWSRPRTYQPPVPGVPTREPPPETCCHCGGPVEGGNNVMCGGPAIRLFCLTCYPQIRSLRAERYDLEKRSSARIERNRQWRVYRKFRAKSEAAQIGDEFARAWLRTYVPRTSVQARAKEVATMWSRNESMREQYPFFTLSGPAGVGKSHLMVGMWREMAYVGNRAGSVGTFVRETQFNTRWLASHDSYDKGTRGGFSDPYGDQSYSSDTTPPELIASMAQTSEVLFVDDVGKVKPTEAWQRAMFEVIYHRHERRLPTVFSTNYSPDTMIQRMDAATNDRLWSGVVILLDGISVRHERRLVVGSS